MSSPVTPPVCVYSDPQFVETKHTLTSSRRQDWLVPPITNSRLWLHSNHSTQQNCGVMQWWLLAAAFDYIAFQRRKYLCVRQFTLKSLSFPEVFVPIQEVINSWSSWSTLRTLVWLRSALIRLYLHCSERWQPVAWGFVFCFHGRSQVCVCMAPPDKNHYPAVMHCTVSTWASTMVFTVTQLICSVNNGG